MSFYQTPTVWHVIFHPSDEWWWPGKYRHVSLAGYSNDTWMHIDLFREGASMSPIYHYDEIEDYLSLILSHFEVLRVSGSQGASRSFLAPMSCVSFAKHVLGVRSCALLPDGLHRTLLENYGAVRLNETEHT